MLFNELQLCVDKIEMLEQLLAQPRPQKMLRECTFDMIWPMLALLFWPTGWAYAAHACLAVLTDWLGLCPSSMICNLKFSFKSLVLLQVDCWWYVLPHWSKSKQMCLENGPIVPRSSCLNMVVLFLIFKTTIKWDWLCFIKCSSSLKRSLHQSKSFDKISAAHDKGQWAMCHDNTPLETWHWSYGWFIRLYACKVKQPPSCVVKAVPGKGKLSKNCDGNIFWSPSLVLACCIQLSRLENNLLDSDLIPLAWCFWFQ